MIWFVLFIKYAASVCLCPLYCSAHKTAETTLNDKGCKTGYEFWSAARDWHTCFAIISKVGLHLIEDYRSDLT